MRTIVKLLSVLVLATLTFQAPAGAGDDIPGYRSSDNLELVHQVAPGTGGTDIEFFTRELRRWFDADGVEHIIDEEDPPVTRHFAVVGNQNTGPKIVDITEPEIAYQVSAMPSCRPSQGDVQIHPDGMLVGLAKQGGTCTLPGGGAAPHGAILVDVSDVYAPEVISVASAPRGAHNITFTPDGNYVYVSESGDSPGQIPIYDISDPATPRKIKDWAMPSGDSPHDIRLSEDGTRAYGAGIDQFRIFDTTDPENPSVIVTFTVPGSTIGHDTLITPDKRFLFAGDEMNGGGTAPCPGGAIYVYDLLDETSPELIGIVEAESGPVTGRNVTEAFVGSIGGCTSHVMDLNPDKMSLTIGWYVSGLRTFDFSGLYDAQGNPSPSPSLRWGSLGVGPVLEDGWLVGDGGSTWSAKQYSEVPGYIFADDRNLGLLVVKITE